MQWAGLTLRLDLVPLFKEHSVAAYFCGHDHDLQHLQLANVSTQLFVSGAGSQASLAAHVPSLSTLLKQASCLIDPRSSRICVRDT